MSNSSKQLSRIDTNVSNTSQRSNLGVPESATSDISPMGATIKGPLYDPYEKSMSMIGNSPDRNIHMVDYSKSSKHTQRSNANERFSSSDIKDEDEEHQSGLATSTWSNTQTSNVYTNTDTDDSQTGKNIYSDLIIDSRLKIDPSMGPYGITNDYKSNSQETIIMDSPIESSMMTEKTNKNYSKVYTRKGSTDRYRRYPWSKKKTYTFDPEPISYSKSNK
ncbi:uncharacterized protein L201_003773 [Kwoniella dendrophila CBS 6074]|uniref:Uncharacterized protein n=1 Tax=Kwoniella dendrophila CBS 6074 TaxID=1295534 RepID=A0AAX4JWE5_9TREE